MARQFWIDITKVKGQDCLTFMDNGAGMDYEKMHKMLSFGFSDKQTINGHVPVGLYGNGFKSGSMRLGKDTIVFSKKAGMQCVGMLSQTYLQETGAENVLVPIVMFKYVGQTLCPELEHEACLQDILKHSLFKTKEELFSEFGAIDGCSKSSTGTRIIIWNLRKTSEGTSEFDFESDRYDVRIPAEMYEDKTEQNKQLQQGIQSVPGSICSLRDYCSILYLKPRMQIIIRGQKVKTQFVSKCLAHRIKDCYKPQFLQLPPNKAIQIIFGYNTRNKEQYGLMMYHKKRLIKAYERVGCQLKANNIGVGVIGVIECDYLQPTHNKQDFDSTDEYRKTVYNVGVKLEEYWKEVRHRLKATVPVEDIVKRPDQNWVQCDACQKWRKLPDGIDHDKLPEKWFCHLNPDNQFRSCTVPEEPEDSDDEQNKYQKTYKKHERDKRLQQEKSRQKMEEEKKKAEQQKKKAEEEKKKAEEKQFKELKEKNAALMKRQQDLERQLRFASPPSVPSFPAEAPSKPSHNSRPLTHASSGPDDDDDDMPVISNVISLSSSTPVSAKRLLDYSRENRYAKRLRISNGFCGKMQDRPSTSTPSQEPCSLPATVISNKDDGKDAREDDASLGIMLVGKGSNNNDKNYNSDNDNDLIIVESRSTPRPKSAFDLSKVKSESSSTEDQPEIHTKSSEVLAMETMASTEITAAASSTKQVNMCTQTDLSLTVKKEEDSEREKAEKGKEVEGRGYMGVETEQGVVSVERKTNQKPEHMQRSINAQVNTATSLVKENGERNNNQSNCSATEMMEVKLPKSEEINPGSEEEALRSVTHKDSLQDLTGRNELSVLEAQQQQDHLLELLEVASRERDESRTQVEELQSKLLELTQNTLKKEQYEQSTQTSTAEEEQEKGYKALYLQAREEIEKLKHELEHLKREPQSGAENREESKLGPARLEMFDGVDDELACQVDLLLRQVEEGNKEQQELKSKLDCLEQEKSKLLICCENLQKELKREREKVKRSLEEQQAQTEFPDPQQQENEADAREPSNPSQCATTGANHERPGRERGQEGTDTLECSLKLRELRQRVGHLLVTFVPALDLEQVNYDCDVIDEILEQVINEITSTRTVLQ
ncbi:MORC family CW-type zinc finger protein 3-like isoform X2 [Hoplias malabaricus]